MPHEQTVFLLKRGNAIQHWETICAEIVSLNLTIKKYCALEPTQSDLTTRYHNISDALWYALWDETIKHLAWRQKNGNECMLFWVVGDNAIERLANHAGRHIDSSQCEPHTIRFRYGEPAQHFSNELTYFPNAIHYSQNQREAKLDAALFFE